MQELFNKTKELEELAININNVQNEYFKIIMKIEEIHFLQLKIETKLEINEELKNEYNKWKEEKLNLIFWFIRLGKYIANLKKQNISLTKSENASLKNLIQFLTKYNYICRQDTDEKIKEKIEIQINNLFQNIFKTDKKLIKNKDIVTKIVPYFEYNPVKVNNYKYFKGSFLINLNTKVYYDENLDMFSCCYYDSSLPRKVVAMLINDGNQNIVVDSEEELNKISNYQIIGLKGVCEDVIEGWYKLDDVKFVEN